MIEDSSVTAQAYSMANVLIVDEPLLGSKVKEVLQKDGHDVFYEAEPSWVLYRWPEYPSIDVILTDARLSHQQMMDGPTLLNHLARARSDAAYLCAGRDLSFSELDRIRNSGVAEFIPKPSNGDVSSYARRVRDSVKWCASNGVRNDNPLADIGPSRGRILVVDDQEPVRMLLHAALSSEHEVLLAANGSEVLEKWTSYWPLDAVLTDYDLGDMTGAHLLSSIPITTPNPVYVGMSGLVTDDRREELRRFGAYTMIEKPFDLLQLKRLVGHVVTYRTFCSR
ncbi:response regulator [Candidatus Woesearchaeota archaeon]|nr:response regulator [Candidatus Woesearchaeota archaeon]